MPGVIFTEQVIGLFDEKTRHYLQQLHPERMRPSERQEVIVQLQTLVDTIARCEADSSLEMAAKEIVIKGQLCMFLTFLRTTWQFGVAGALALDETTVFTKEGYVTEWGNQPEGTVVTLFELNEFIKNRD